MNIFPFKSNDGYSYKIRVDPYVVFIFDNTVTYANYLYYYISEIKDNSEIWKHSLISTDLKEYVKKLIKLKGFW